MTAAPAALRRRLLARLQQVEESGRTAALIEFHASCKYLLMAHGRHHLSALGSIVAHATERSWSSALHDYRAILSGALRAPAPVPSTIDALMHVFGYVSGRLTPAARAAFLADLDRLRRGELTVSCLLTALHAWALQYDEPYLRSQVWFDPCERTHGDEPRGEVDMDDVGSHILDDLRRQFAAQRTLAERALAQLDDDQLFRSDGDGSNSIAVLMQHVGGNLRSRWTDALTTDGEKPDRDRDGEFELASGASVEDVRRTWDEGWQTVEAALASYSGDDLLRTITIREQPLTLAQGLLRSLAHTAQHVGQVVLLARRWKGADWQTLSIPRGRSAEYLRRPPA